MKRFLILFSAFILFLSLMLTVGCGASCAPENYGGGTGQNTQDDGEEISEMYVTVNGNKLKVTLEQNPSVAALIDILKQGDITFTADKNGNFEMYGDIGHNLPTNNKHISAQAGDVILYSGRYLCLFFGNNSYSYTRIGKINGYSPSELRALLGADQGRVQVTVGLQ